MIGIVRGDQGGQCAVKELLIGGFQIGEGGRIPVPRDPAAFHLVVAAPQREAGVMAQALHNLFRFNFHVGEKICIIERIDAQAYMKSCQTSTP